MGIHIGSVVRDGKYIVKLYVASGTIVSVYLIEEESSGREFILKVLPSHTAGKEAYLFSRLPPHPNVVDYYEHWEEDGELFFVVQSYENCTLTEMITCQTDWEKKTEEDLMCYLHTIACAVAHLHNHNIAHRDLRPDNIFFSNGVLRIANPSLVYTCGRTSSGYVGFSYFVSPQMMSGQACGVATDVYSFGCIAYNMLMRTHPVLADGGDR
eukprot:Rmarinus@m.18291